MLCYCTLMFFSTVIFIFLPKWLTKIQCHYTSSFTQFYFKRKCTIYCFFSIAHHILHHSLHRQTEFTQILNWRSIHVLTELKCYFSTGLVVLSCWITSSKWFNCKISVFSIYFWYWLHQCHPQYAAVSRPRSPPT